MRNPRQLSDEEMELLSAEVDEPEPLRGAFDALWSVEDNSGVADVERPTAHWAEFQQSVSIDSEDEPWYPRPGVAARHFFPSAGRAIGEAWGLVNPPAIGEGIADFIPGVEIDEDEGFTEQQVQFGRLVSDLFRLVRSHGDIRDRGRAAREAYYEGTGDIAPDPSEPIDYSSEYPTLQPMMAGLETITPIHPTRGWQGTHALSRVVEQEPAEFAFDIGLSATGIGLATAGVRTGVAGFRSARRALSPLDDIADTLGDYNLMTGELSDVGRLRHATVGIEVQTARSWDVRNLAQFGRRSTLSRGTGTVVSDSELVTASHVLTGSSDIELPDIDRIRATTYTGEQVDLPSISGILPEADIAVLDLPELEGITPLGISGGVPDVDPLYGRISRKRGYQQGVVGAELARDAATDSTLRQLSIEGEAGYSGAGLVTEQGELGGLYLGTLRGQGIIADAPTVRGFLESDRPTVGISDFDRDVHRQALLERGLHIQAAGGLGRGVPLGLHAFGGEWDVSGWEHDYGDDVGVRRITVPEPPPPIEVEIQARFERGRTVYRREPVRSSERGPNRKFEEMSNEQLRFEMYYGDTYGKERAAEILEERGVGPGSLATSDAARIERQRWDDLEKETVAVRKEREEEVGTESDFDDGYFTPMSNPDAPKDYTETYKPQDYKREAWESDEPKGDDTGKYYGGWVDEYGDFNRPDFDPSEEISAGTDVYAAGGETLVFTPYHEEYGDIDIGTGGTLEGDLPGSSKVSSFQRFQGTESGLRPETQARIGRMSSAFIQRAMEREAAMHRSPAMARSFVRELNERLPAWRQWRENIQIRQRELDHPYVRPFYERQVSAQPEGWQSDLDQLWAEGRYDEYHYKFNPVATQAMVEYLDATREGRLAADQPEARWQRELREQRIADNALVLFGGTRGRVPREGHVATPPRQITEGSDVERPLAVRQAEAARLEAPPRDHVAEFREDVLSAEVRREAEEAGRQTYDEMDVVPAGNPLFWHQEQAVESALARQNRSEVERQRIRDRERRRVAGTEPLEEPIVYDSAAESMAADAWTQSFSSMFSESDFAPGAGVIEIIGAQAYTPEANAARLIESQREFVRKQPSSAPAMEPVSELLEADDPGLRAGELHDIRTAHRQELAAERRRETRVAEIEAHIEHLRGQQRQIAQRFSGERYARRRELDTQAIQEQIDFQERQLKQARGRLELHSSVFTPSEPLDLSTPRAWFRGSGISSERTYGLELELLTDLSRPELSRLLDYEVMQGLKIEGDISIETARRDIGVVHEDKWGDTDRVEAAKYSQYVAQFEGPSWERTMSPDDFEDWYAHELVFPKMQGQQGIDLISETLETLQGVQTEFNTSMGMHVHVGAEDLKNYDLVGLWGAFAARESVIDLMHEPSRRGMGNTFAESMLAPPQGTVAGARYNLYGSEYEGFSRWGVTEGQIGAGVGERLDSAWRESLLSGQRREDFLDKVRYGDRYQKLNLRGFEHKTIEYRQPAPTLDPEEAIQHVRFITDFVDEFAGKPLEWAYRQDPRLQDEFAGMDFRFERPRELGQQVLPLGLELHSEGITSDYIWRFLSPEDRDIIGISRESFAGLGVHESISALKSFYPGAETLGEVLQRGTETEGVFFRAQPRDRNLLGFRSYDLDMTREYMRTGVLRSGMELGERGGESVVTRSGVFAGSDWEAGKGFLVPEGFNQIEDVGYDFENPYYAEGGDELLIFSGQELPRESHWHPAESIVEPLEELYRVSESMFSQYGRRIVPGSGLQRYIRRFGFEDAPAELFAVSPQRRYLSNQRDLELHSAKGDWNVGEWEWDYEDRSSAQQVARAADASDLPPITEDPTGWDPDYEADFGVPRSESSPETVVPERIAPELTPSQQRALRHTTGAAVVMAGPGSGKSTTLIERLRYLSEEGIATSDDVLTLVFGRKARESLQERALELGGDWNIMTVDAFARSVVRENFGELDYTRAPDISNQTFESWLLEPDRLDEYGATGSRRDVVSEWSDLYEEARRGITSGREDYSALPENVQRAIHDFRLEKFQSARMDHTDAISQAGYLLESNEAIRQRYQERFKFLQVDEFQDVSPTQARLLRHVSPNPWVVGDLDQSIMSFRGGAGGAMREMIQEGAQLYNIEENFRSTPEIVQAAQGFIASNLDRIGVSQRAVGGSGDPVSMVGVSPLSTEREAIARIAEQVRPGEQTAILTRTRRERDVIKEELPIDLREQGWEESDIENLLAFETMHGAKGREWQNVILPINLLEADHGNRQRLFTLPTRYARTAADFAEEERLFYVGMTRAEERLTIMGDSQHPYYQQVTRAIEGGESSTQPTYLDPVESSSVEVEPRGNFLGSLVGKFGGALDRFIFGDSVQRQRRRSRGDDDLELHSDTRYASEHFMRPEYFQEALDRGFLTGGLGRSRGLLYFSEGAHYRGKERGETFSHGFFFDPDELEQDFGAIAPVSRVDAIMRASGQDLSGSDLAEILEYQRQYDVQVEPDFTVGQDVPLSSAIGVSDETGMYWIDPETRSSDQNRWNLWSIDDLELGDREPGSFAGRGVQSLVIPDDLQLHGLSPFDENVLMPRPNRGRGLSFVERFSRGIDEARDDRSWGGPLSQIQGVVQDAAVMNAVATFAWEGTRVALGDDFNLGSLIHAGAASAAAIGLKIADARLGYRGVLPESRYDLGDLGGAVSDVPEGASDHLQRIFRDAGAGTSGWGRGSLSRELERYDLDDLESMFGESGAAYLTEFAYQSRRFGQRSHQTQRSLREELLDVVTGSVPRARRYVYDPESVDVNVETRRRGRLDQFLEWGSERFSGSLLDSWHQSRVRSRESGEVSVLDRVFGPLQDEGATPHGLYMTLPVARGLGRLWGRFHEAKPFDQQGLRVDLGNLDHVLRRRGADEWADRIEARKEIGQEREAMLEARRMDPHLYQWQDSQHFFSQISQTLGIDPSGVEFGRSRVASPYSRFGRYFSRLPEGAEYPLAAGAGLAGGYYGYEMLFGDDDEQLELEDPVGYSVSPRYPVLGALQRTLPYRRLRARSENLLDDVYGEDSFHGEMLKSMILGKRNNLPREVKDTFLGTGQVHTLTQSGMHVSMFSNILSRYPVLAAPAVLSTARDMISSPNEEVVEASQSFLDRYRPKDSPWAPRFNPSLPSQAQIRLAQSRGLLPDNYELEIPEEPWWAWWSNEDNYRAAEHQRMQRPPSQGQVDLLRARGLVPDDYEVPVSENTDVELNRGKRGFRNVLPWMVYGMFGVVPETGYSYMQTEEGEREDGSRKPYAIDGFEFDVEESPFPGFNPWLDPHPEGQLGDTSVGRLRELEASDAEEELVSSEPGESLKELYTRLGIPLTGPQTREHVNLLLENDPRGKTSGDEKRSIDQIRSSNRAKSSGPVSGKAESYIDSLYRRLEGLPPAGYDAEKTAAFVEAGNFEGLNREQGSHVIHFLQQELSKDAPDSPDAPAGISESALRYARSMRSQWQGTAPHGYDETQAQEWASGDMSGLTAEQGSHAIYFLQQQQGDDEGTESAAPAGMSDSALRYARSIRSQWQGTAPHGYDETQAQEWAEGDMSVLTAEQGSHAIYFLQQQGDETESTVDAPSGISASALRYARSMRSQWQGTAPHGYDETQAREWASGDISGLTAEQGSHAIYFLQQQQPEREDKSQTQMSDASFRYLQSLAPDVFGEAQYDVMPIEDVDIGAARERGYFTVGEGSALIDYYKAVEKSEGPGRASEGQEAFLRGKFPELFEGMSREEKGLVPLPQLSAQMHEIGYLTPDVAREMFRHVKEMPPPMASPRQRARLQAEFPWAFRSVGQAERYLESGASYGVVESLEDIYDADTFTGRLFDAEQGVTFKEDTVRLGDFNAPEIKPDRMKPELFQEREAARATEARDVFRSLVEQFNVGRDVEAEGYVIPIEFRHDAANLGGLERGFYGRVLGDVNFEGIDYEQFMIQQGMGSVYGADVEWGAEQIDPLALWRRTPTYSERLGEATTESLWNIPGTLAMGLLEGHDPATAVEGTFRGTAERLKQTAITEAKRTGIQATTDFFKEKFTDEFTPNNLSFAQRYLGDFGGIGEGLGKFMQSGWGAALAPIALAAGTAFVGERSLDANYADVIPSEAQREKSWNNYLLDRRENEGLSPQGGEAVGLRLIKRALREVLSETGLGSMQDLSVGVERKLREDNARGITRIGRM